MKYAIIFFFSLLFNLKTIFVSAQVDHEIDSMITVVASLPKDSNSVPTLCKLGWLYADRSLFKEANQYYLEALELSQKTGFKKGMARSYRNLGELKIKQDSFAAAVQNLNMALEIANEIRDSSVMVEANGRLGLANDYMGNYQTAIRYYLISLQLAEETGDKYNIGAANQNLGCIYKYWFDQETSLKYSLAALKIWQEIDNKYHMADAYLNIAESYSNLCDDEEAEKYTLLGVNLAKEIGQNYALGAGLSELGIIHSMRGEFQKALTKYLESLAVWEKIGDRQKIASTMLFVGNGYVKVNNLSEAITYFKRGLNTAKEIDSKLDMQDAYKYLSDAYALSGNYQQSLDYLKLYIAIADFLFNQSNMQQINSLKEQYESEKKDKDIALLNEKNSLQTLALSKQKQNNYFFILGLILITGLSFFIYKNYQNRQQLKLLALRNKIAGDLHDDVGATLSSISLFSQLAQSQSKEVIPALQTIGESSRKMLDAMADIVWTINPENDEFEKIIMRMRSFAYELLGAKQIEFQFLVDENAEKLQLPMEARKNLYLIFKESLNNMVKYSNADQASMSIKTDRNRLSMMIRDNGKGFDAGKEYQGNGLKNMKRRAEEMGAILEIETAPGTGTTIKLDLAA